LPRRVACLLLIDPQLSATSIAPPPLGKEASLPSSTTRTGVAQKTLSPSTPAPAHAIAKISSGCADANRGPSNAPARSTNLSRIFD
jgi:hypothetical protein